MYIIIKTNFSLYLPIISRYRLRRTDYNIIRRIFHSLYITRAIIFQLETTDFFLNFSPSKLFKHNGISAPIRFPDKIQHIRPLNASPDVKI